MLFVTISAFTSTSVWNSSTLVRALPERARVGLVAGGPRRRGDDRHPLLDTPTSATVCPEWTSTPVSISRVFRAGTFWSPTCVECALSSSLLRSRKSRWIRSPDTRRPPRHTWPYSLNMVTSFPWGSSPGVTKLTSHEHRGGDWPERPPRMVRPTAPRGGLWPQGLDQ